MTLMITGYRTKSELKAAVGKPLVYEETSMFGKEYKPDGRLPVAHRPKISARPGREFYAIVTMEAGIIKKVE